MQQSNCLSQPIRRLEGWQPVSPLSDVYFFLNKYTNGYNNLKLLLVCIAKFHLHRQARYLQVSPSLLRLLVPSIGVSWELAVLLSSISTVAVQHKSHFSCGLTCKQLQGLVQSTLLPQKREKENKSLDVNLPAEMFSYWMNVFLNIKYLPSG